MIENPNAASQSFSLAITASDQRLHVKRREEEKTPKNTEVRAHEAALSKGVTECPVGEVVGIRMR